MRKGLIGLLAVLALVFAACSESTSSDDTTAATTAATEAPTGGGDSVNGEVLYNGGCIACHGPNGEGIEGLGKPWVGSDFINSSSDAEMVAFLLVGRPSDDPLNTTGIAMLPKGGNSSLSDGDLQDLVAYMRTLNT
ncbi:MAG: cytochrome c [Acidimicrobiia bacterium]